jgi:tryptophan halogenase
VVAVGNASGFVEPLEASALQVICVQARTLADALLDSVCAPPPSVVALYNELNTNSWDDIRNFLAVHYAFNDRLDTPFWKTCRGETDLAGAARMVEFYRENGPSSLGKAMLVRPTDSFGMEGYLALLAGQMVPHAKPHTPAPAELKLWQSRVAGFGREAMRGFTVKQSLDAIRHRDWKW